MPKLYRDATIFVKAFPQYQTQDNISQKYEFPLSPILEVKLFDVWGLDFIGLFVKSFGNQYIFVTVDYVSKWVEVVALPTSDGNGMINFLNEKYPY